GARALPAVELPPAAGPVERLSALARPRDSAFAVDVLPVRPDDAGRWRDITVTAARRERPFRLGDPIRFAVTADRDCHVALIDVGTSGAVAAVVPNAWCPPPEPPDPTVLAPTRLDVGAPAPAVWQH